MVTVARIDNDQTKGLAQPFLILAHVRTGGTFLAHALSSHPQIYCDRGETLHHLSAWRKAGIPAVKTVKAIWNQDGYFAAGFRAIYRQAFHEQIWPLVLERKPKIIHLTRRNITRQGVSFGYQQLVRQGVIPFHPVHTFETRKVVSVKVNPAVIVKYAEKVRAEIIQARNKFASYPGQILTVSYEAMTGECNTSYVSDKTCESLLDFLGVQKRPLSVELRRDFDAPMSAWFANWQAIKGALEKAGFGGLDG